MRERLARREFERGVVGDFAVFDHAAVAVVGVFAKADIGDDQEIEFGFANGFDSALDDALCVKRALAARIFCFWQAEENHRGKAEAFDFATFFDDLIRGLLMHAGHGADFGANFAAGANEHRINQPVGGETRFAHETP